MNDMQPGQPVDQGNQPTPQQPMQTVPPTPVAPTPPIASQVPTAASRQTTQPSTGFYNPLSDDAQALAQMEANGMFQSQAPAMPAAPIDEEITWTASEFVEHEKDAKWYLSLVGISIVLIAVVYLISRDRISTGVVALVMIGFGYFAGHRPRAQQYAVSAQGVRVGTKEYDFQDYKSFSIAEEGSTISVVLMPLKRFMPPLTIYVAQDQEERVANFLSSFLPFDHHKADAVENLMRRIRF